MARIFIAVVAVTSLFASSASACTCSHHQEEVKADEPACHSHVQHQDAAAEAVGAFLTGVESPCECVIAKPAPAVLSKSDKRTASSQPDADRSELSKPAFEREAILMTVVANTERENSSFLSRHLAGLLPSRAPPRL